MLIESHRRWVIFLLSCLLFTFSQFYRSSIAVISPNLVADLNLDTKDLGIISAAFFYAFAVMQIPVGLYLDSVGPRILMTALSLTAAAGAMIFAFGESSTVLMIGRICLGLGMACNLMGPLKLMTSWFSPRRFATLSTIFLSVGTAGNIAAATPLAWLTQTLGWRTTFYLFALCNLVIVILFYMIARDNPSNTPSEGRVSESPIESSTALSGLWRLMSLRDYWIISLGTFFRYGVFASIQALWAGPFLMITMGYSQIMAGNLLLVISIGLIGGSPMWGWASDTILHSRKRIVITGLVVMAITLMALALVPGHVPLPVLFALFFSFGFASGAGQIMYVHIKERVPHENAGAAMTGINFFTMIGVAFFLHGLGWIIKVFYPQGLHAPETFRTAFMVFSGCLIFASLLYRFTVDSKRHPDRP